MGRILYAEDNQGLRETLHSYFEERGYDVRTATDGVAALNVFQAETPDVLITDNNMPGMDGLELIRHIRETNRDIPIIMLTATSATELEELKSWAQPEVLNFQLMEKPTNFPVLQELVKSRMQRNSRGDFGPA